MIPLAGPIVTDSQKKAVLRVLESGHFILGENVSEFEKDFAAYHDCKYGIGVSSGTSALNLSMLALDIKSGDEVITVPNTFIATANAIAFSGAKPVFVDIDEKTFNMNPELLSEKITSKTKAIVPVHLNGYPAEMKPIMEIANDAGIPVVEDCCQAHGAKCYDQSVGSFGKIACFSFYPSKNLTVCGDGGMAITNDESLERKLKAIRNYGQDRRYHHLFIGHNSRLSEISAAIGREQLKDLPIWTNARRKNANLYNKLLSRSNLMLPKEASWARPVYHYYVVRSDARDKLVSHLSSKQIGVGIHYPIPIHLQPAYEFLGHKKGDFPITEACADSIISLPSHPKMTETDVRTVCDAILELEG